MSGRAVGGGPAGDGGLPTSGGRRAGLQQASGVVLVVGLAASFFAQGGFFPAGRRPLEVAVAVSTALALAARPPVLADLRFPVTGAAVLLGVWAVVRGVATGAVPQGLDRGMLLTGMVVVVVVCRRQDDDGRELVLLGLVGIGSALAVTGWVGVALHHAPWALPSDGLWRASSTLTYANSTAAVLVAFALVTLALLRARPGSRGLAAALAVLLVGAGATLTRAGLLALVVGLVVLAALAGWREVTRAGAAPALGACVALLALLPSMPVAAPGRLPVAAGGLLLGLGVALVRVPVGVPRRVVVGAAIGSVAATGLALRAGPLARALADIGHVRASLDSAHRTDAFHAAWALVLAHPVLGTGPGRVDLHWQAPGGVTGTLIYAHDEYLQVLMELGAVGLALLLVLLGAGAVVVARGRGGGGYPAAWAGVVAALTALAVHSAFDFVWHLPVIPLTAAVLVGLVAAPLPPEPRSTRPGLRRPTERIKS